jgi:hypothetical protein
MNKAEEEFVDKLVVLFSKYFEVQREVKSNTRKDRIDLLLTIDGKYHFGVECKTPNKKKGEKIAEYINQAKRYTTAEWEYRPNVFVKALIFICPPLSYNYFIMNEESKFIDGIEYHKDRHHKLHNHSTMNSFLCGIANIGEVRKKPLGYQFSFMNKPIFEHKIYPHTGKDYSSVHEVNYNFYMNILCSQ